MNRFARAGLVAVTLALTQSAVNVAFAATENLPPLHRQGAVTYLSGGIGSDQSAALKDVMHQYPLVLEFAGKSNQGNEYLADVPVHITDMNGTTILNATAQGPFMLASLPAGRYRISASYDGKTQQRVVDITPSGHTQTLFLWPAGSNGGTS
ncbi:carboxypeptidase regulatory-like domain-containing protein [Paraburkholderia sp. Tr-20389]|uniref:carboxypeptidase-like regulatory domain-containing protein n=1 Tax=Paraburkholderia sp. Tr-20389 TaxID=2703903 RepID=UPI00197EECDE|nr:carboxypeptidase-like regulatory domain-containing protein [Paraburkholderia sp. Tr-20389]MBN3753076.1 carboxypeptidase regulatory-like domain-containing protein [Paraburkholderia sp. Tr-20389]